LIICALVVLALVATVSAATSEDLQFSQFLKFVDRYSKRYKSMDEFSQRFVAFQANLKRIEELNQAQPGENVFGITPFADMSAEEFKATKLGFVPSGHRNHGHHAPVASSTNLTATSVDWRTKGMVTPVKDQGQCGSCWAFSTAEAIESQWAMAGNTLTAFSPQQITSCDKTDAGCNGGDTPTAYAYVQSAGGIETEKAYPYTSGGGTTGTCKFDKSKIAGKITGFAYATKPCQDSCTKQDETTLASAVATVGPVSVCVDAESWQLYSSGILKSNCPKAYSDLDHCVQVVGYNTDGGASSSYWIVRNSWNTSWGVNGYIYVLMGQNLCGIADEATYPTI